MEKPKLSIDVFLVNLAIAISVISCFIFYYYNRSLFLDSLNLARNIAESSYTELSLPLRYEQSAPLLFLYLSKLITSVLGVSEYSLRLIPMLSGIGSIFFFSKILKKLLPLKYVAFGILFFGTHIFVLRYTTEFKQYMTDTFVCIFLIWLSLTYKKLTLKNTFIFGICGALAIWISMPSIFVLSGVLAYLLYYQYKSNARVLLVFILGIWIALNFIAEYFIILEPAIRSTHMQNFHNHYFLQGRFWEIQSIQHDFGLILGTIRLVVGKSGIAIGVSMLLISVGLHNFWKSRNGLGLLLLCPLLAVIIASILGKYSMIERLMLFTLPLILLIILWGAKCFLDSKIMKNKWIYYSSVLVLGLSALISYSQIQGLIHLIQPMEIEDNRSALIYISNQSSHDAPVICTQLAFPAFEYYTKHDIYYQNLELGEGVGAEYDEKVKTLLEDKLKQNHSEVWILMGHMSEHEISEMVNQFEKTGKIKNSYRTNKSAAILYATQ